MATLADSLVSSSSRKLPIRMRPDLRARRHRYQGRNYWVVKDPVGLQYFRFEEEEFAILQMLDGESSLDEIAEQFERDFPPQTIRIEELQQFIGMLHKSNLVITDASGQGAQLKKRRDERKSQERWATLANILSLRFKGIDPERLLNFLLRYVGWFFTVPAMICCLALALTALTLVVVQFDVFRSRLPDFHAFFGGPQNWLLLAATLGCTKVLHEFGHGLSCKKFGGECHEMGIMMLVMTPCLYCNVSDSWMLPSRWQRAAIGAAGMYVELVLASICTFLWWSTDPDTYINKISLNVMFISSVSTVMFNANPLLRYDGYYILSDILEIPNLRQKASTILNRKLGKWCLGLEEPEDPFLPKRHQTLFALYTVASAVYRWVVTLSILYFLNKVFEPYGLKVLGQVIALGAVYGLVVQPVVNVYKFFKVPGRLGKVVRWRMYTTIGLLVALVAGVLFIPLPSHIYTSLEVQPRNAASVYVEQPGILEAVYVQPGDRVDEGQLLAELSDLSLDVMIAERKGQRDAYKAQVAALHNLSFEERDSASQIAEAREGLRAAEEQYAESLRDRDKLKLVAPKSGVVLPPTLVPSQPSEGQLPHWSGSPLKPENLGATLQVGTKLCEVGDPRWLEARLVVDQGDVELIAPGQKVEIMLNQSSDFVFVSQIERVAKKDLKTSPVHLSSLHGGELATKMGDDGVARPVSRVFEVAVPLPEDDKGIFRIGLVGRAKVTTAPRTLGSRLWRYFSRTFNFEL
ncbi:MAG: HlyD family efflux transporter periplasmic adaptor subunit [Pirellulales bacterium]